MQKVWKDVKGYKGIYRISNFGEVFSIISKRNLTPTFINNCMIVCLCKSGKRKNLSLGKLVLKHFKENEINKDYCLHLDLNGRNNRISNLEWSTIGDIHRYYKEKKQQRRGVYKYSSKYLSLKNPERSKSRWRAMLKFDGKYKTLGYFKTKKEAEACFFNKYVEVYGRRPY